MDARARFWDGAAEGYARKPVPDEAVWQAKLTATKALLRADDAVLDLGCGTGSLALELAPHAAHVLAVDVSGEMIRIGEDKVRAAGADNVSFLRASIEAPLELPPASFDMVCAFSILHLVDDVDQTLELVFALLKPGGHFVSSTVCIGETWLPVSLLIALMRWVGKAPPVVHSLTVDGLVDRMQRAGFVGVERQVVSRDAKNAFLFAQKPG